MDRYNRDRVLHPREDEEFEGAMEALINLATEQSVPSRPQRVIKPKPPRELPDFNLPPKKRGRPVAASLPPPRPTVSALAGQLTPGGKERVLKNEERVKASTQFTKYFEDKPRRFRLVNSELAGKAEDCYIMWCYVHKHLPRPLDEYLNYFRFYPATYLQDADLLKALKGLKNAAQLEDYLKERYGTKKMGRPSHRKYFKLSQRSLEDEEEEFDYGTEFRRVKRRNGVRRKDPVQASGQALPAPARAPAAAAAAAAPPPAPASADFLPGNLVASLAFSSLFGEDFAFSAPSVEPEPAHVADAAAPMDYMPEAPPVEKKEERKEDVNERDPATGKTKLMLAAESGDAAEMLRLLSKKARVNDKWDLRNGGNGQTALMLAASQGHEECMKALFMQKNLDKHVVDYSGKNALTYAAMGVESAAAEDGEAGGSGGGAEAALSPQTVRDKAAAVHFLSKAGLDVNAIDKSGKTAVMYAAKAGLEPVVSQLLAAGADFTITVSGDYNNTALDYAMAGNHYECAYVLLKAGAKVCRLENLQFSEQSDQRHMRCILALVTACIDASPESFYTFLHVNGLYNFLDRFVENYSEEELHTFVRSSRTASLAMLRMLSGIMTHSRLPAGKPVSLKGLSPLPDKKRKRNPDYGGTAGGDKWIDKIFSMGLNPMTALPETDNEPFLINAIKTWKLDLAKFLILRTKPADLFAKTAVDARGKNAVECAMEVLKSKESFYDEEEWSNKFLPTRDALRRTCRMLAHLPPIKGVVPLESPEMKKVKSGLGEVLRWLEGGIAREKEKKALQDVINMLVQRLPEEQRQMAAAVVPTAVQPQQPITLLVSKPAPLPPVATAPESNALIAPAVAAAIATGATASAAPATMDASADATEATPDALVNVRITVDCVHNLRKVSSEAAAAIRRGNRGLILETQEVLTLLSKAVELNMPFSTVPMEKPPAGSMFLFNKSETPFFRKDSYKFNRESHNTLKLDGKPRIKVYYATLPDATLQRRAYFDIENLDRGLVHYIVPASDSRTAIHSKASSIAFKAQAQQMGATKGGLPSSQPVLPSTATEPPVKPESAPPDLAITTDAKGSSEELHPLSAPASPPSHQAAGAPVAAESLLLALAAIGTKLQLPNTDLEACCSVVQDSYAKLAPRFSLPELVSIPKDIPKQISQLMNGKTWGDLNSAADTARWKAAIAEVAVESYIVEKVVNMAISRLKTEQEALQALEAASTSNKLSMAKALAKVSVFLPKASVTSLVSYIFSESCSVDFAALYFESIRDAILSGDFELAQQWLNTALASKPSSS